MTARRTLLPAALTATLALLAGAPARADDLPAPHVHRAGAVPPLRSPSAAPPRTVRTPPAPAASAALPSGPVALRGRSHHSTYVPPLGATTTPAPAPRAAAVAAAPAAPRGRVPVTTFRVAPAPQPRRAPAPQPRRAAAPPAPRPIPIARVPQRARTTTWNPRPVPAAPPPRTARAASSGLPSPAVRPASPSYEEIQRTRAHVITSRPRSEPAPTTVRTLQRRAGTTKVRRRAVRSRDLSVPMAPGQSAPVAPIRRTLDLRPPPGCSGGT